MKQPLPTITSVEFGFSENPKAYNRKFSNLFSADRLLYSLNRDAERENLLGYWKTDFAIKFSDGSLYSGRYDIGADAPNLTQHLINYCSAMARQGKTRYQLVADIVKASIGVVVDPNGTVEHFIPKVDLL